MIKMYILVTYMLLYMQFHVDYNLFKATIEFLIVNVICNQISVVNDNCKMLFLFFCMLFETRHVFPVSLSCFNVHVLG